jgi:hypothetical protein
MQGSNEQNSSLLLIVHTDSQFSHTASREAKGVNSRTKQGGSLEEESYGPALY